jgi:CelD/BcsL family acetyltransferase involved in cellulose biosynthesis
MQLQHSIDTSVDDMSTSKWDEFVEHSAGALAQQSVWARLKGEAFTHHVVVERADSGILGGASLLERSVGGVIRVGTVSGGPIAGSVDAAQAVVSELITHARRRKYAALLVCPAIGDAATPEILLRKGFELSEVHISPPATVLVDLEPSIEELFGNLRKSRRRATRRAESAGVEIRQGSVDDLDLFAELHAASALAQGFHGQPVEAIRRQWGELSRLGAIFLFVAELNGEAVAADLLMADGDRVVDKLTGWSATTEARAARPNSLLNWHLIKWAKAQGFRHLDFGGLQLDIAKRLRDGSASRDEFIDHHDYFKLTLGGTPTLLPRTYIQSWLPGGQQAIQWFGRSASTPGPANRILNSLRS